LVACGLLDASSHLLRDTDGDATDRHNISITYGMRGSTAPSSGEAPFRLP
jgi:hypothetical protein